MKGLGRCRGAISAIAVEGINRRGRGRRLKVKILERYGEGSVLSQWRGAIASGGEGSKPRMVRDSELEGDRRWRGGVEGERTGKREI